MYKRQDSSLACSAQTAALVDKKVEEIIAAQREKAKKLLSSNMAQLHTLAKHLYTKETTVSYTHLDVYKRQALYHGHHHLSRRQPRKGGK